MTRLDYLRWKHSYPEPKHREPQPLILNPLSKETEPHKCGDCKFYLNRNKCPRAEYKSIERNKITCLPSDSPCEKFQPKKTKRGKRGERGEEGAKKDYTLDLDAPIPETLEVCGFTGDNLTECCWLPYRDKNGEIEVRPSIILAEKTKDPQIIDFMKQGKIKGTFPSKNLDSLMTPKAAKMITTNTTIDPHKVDKEIDQAINKHLDVGKAERILIKRWVEGSYFYDVFDAYPIQNILGVSESGKSRLCLVNLALCYHAEQCINVTEAGIFRSKEEDKVSMIIDEAEYLNNPKLYATLKILLNASYSKNSGFVTRYDEDSKGRRIKKRFNLYSPLCVSGIAGLSGVTLSRAFRLVMRRTDRDFPKANSKTYRTLRDKLYALRIRHCFDIHKLYENLDISDIVTARFHELFLPLFTLTKFFGTEEEWQTLADWCKEYASNFRIEALNVAKEEMTLVCLSKIQPTMPPDWYALKDLARKIVEEYGKQVTSRNVSSILHRLGITKRKKSTGITLFYAPKALVEESGRRIGLTSFSSPISPISPNSPKQKAEPNESWLQKSFKTEKKE